MAVATVRNLYPQGPSRPVAGVKAHEGMPMRCCGLLALVPVLTPLMALEFDTGAPLWSLRTGFEATPTPQVHEKIKRAAGPTTTEKWGTEDGHGRRFHVGLSRVVPQASGWMLGAEVAYASHVLGGNKDFDGTQGYRQAGADACAGWQWGMTGEQGLRGHVEVTPLVGTGLGWLTNGSGRAPYYEYGLRTGAFIDERSWTAGVLLSYLRGRSELTVERSDTSNALEMTTVGYRFGFEFGYNF